MKPHVSGKGGSGQNGDKGPEVCAQLGVGGAAEGLSGGMEGQRPRSSVNLRGPKREVGCFAEYGGSLWMVGIRGEV